MIQLEQVGKQYGTRPFILENVSLRIEAGQFTCLLGPSGCGKTTLLNLIAGFIKPSSGKVLCDGQPIPGPGPERGVVFQDANLFPWMSVLDNVRFGLRQQGMDRQQATAVAISYLELVGMQEQQASLPIRLSGGQRQRVAIARVLALQPRILLMDEPFSALDANSRERLQEELLRFCSTSPTTVVYVTHHVDEAAFLAERVLIMGPAPHSIHADLRLNQPHPRQRTHEAFHQSQLLLRSHLDQLPCCIAPVQLEGESHDPAVPYYPVDSGLLQPAVAGQCSRTAPFCLPEPDR